MQNSQSLVIRVSFFSTHTPPPTNTSSVTQDGTLEIFFYILMTPELGFVITAKGHD